jgi:hypothetical protein
MLEYERFVDELGEFDCIYFAKELDEKSEYYDWEIYTLKLTEDELQEVKTNSVGTLHTISFFDDSGFEEDFDAYLSDPKVYIKELMSINQNSIVMKKCSVSEKFMGAIKKRIASEALTETVSC